MDKFKKVLQFAVICIVTVGKDKTEKVGIGLINDGFQDYYYSVDEILLV